jgi:hypothetical protein
MNIRKGGGNQGEVENTEWEGRRVECFYVWSSKGGSLRLCRLRTTSVEPKGTSINYILTHMEFMGFYKLSSTDSC